MSNFAEKIHALNEQKQADQKARYEREEREAGRKAKTHAFERVATEGIKALKEIALAAMPLASSDYQAALAARVQILGLLPEDKRASYLEKELEVGGGALEKLLDLAKEMHEAGLLTQLQEKMMNNKEG